MSYKGYISKYENRYKGYIGIILSTLKRCKENTYRYSVVFLFSFSCSGM
jgi:hypothetical protein